MENSNFNQLFETIKLKKQYIKQLKTEVTNFNQNKNDTYKLIKSFNVKRSLLVKYIIDITFSRTNTLLHVMDFAGNLKFYCSAGVLKYTGKSKKSRKRVIRDIYKKILVSKLNYLTNYPVALHLKNVNSTTELIIKLLKKKFCIKVIKIFSSFPYNGCRKKKVRRKKIRMKKRFNNKNSSKNSEM